MCKILKNIKKRKFYLQQSCVVPAFLYIHSGRFWTYLGVFSGLNLGFWDRETLNVLKTLYSLRKIRIKLLPQMKTLLMGLDIWIPPMIHHPMQMHWNKSFFMMNFVHLFTDFSTFRRLLLNNPVESPTIPCALSIFCFEINLNWIILTYLESLPVEKLNWKISVSLIVHNFKRIYFLVRRVLISRTISTIRTINLNELMHLGFERVHQTTDLFVDIKENWIVFAVIIRSNFQINI